jgi:hypothetical protein
MSAQHTRVRCAARTEHAKPCDATICNRTGKQLGAPQQGGDALPAAALAAMPPRVQRALGLAAPTPAPAVAAAAGSSAWSVSHRTFCSALHPLTRLGSLGSPPSDKRGVLKGMAATKPFAFLRG